MKKLKKYIKYLLFKLSLRILEDEDIANQYLMEQGINPAAATDAFLVDLEKIRSKVLGSRREAQ